MLVRANVHVSDIKAPERSGHRVHQSSSHANSNAFRKSLERAVCVIKEDKDLESRRINKRFLQRVNSKLTPIFFKNVARAVVYLRINLLGEM